MRRRRYLHTAGALGQRDVKFSVHDMTPYSSIALLGCVPGFGLWLHAFCASRRRALCRTRQNSHQRSSVGAVAERMGGVLEALWTHRNDIIYGERTFGLTPDLLFERLWCRLLVFATTHCSLQGMHYTARDMLCHDSHLR